LSLLLAAGGFAREVGRFGWNDSSAIGHIEQELARRVVERARALEERARRVANDPGLVEAANNSRDALPDLFASLGRPLASGDDNIASTVWVSSGSGGGYRVLAWSGTPAENVAAEVLSRAPALTVAPGAGGLRLIYVTPVLQDGRRIAVASTESAVAANARPAALPREFALQSSVGSIPAAPVSAEPLGGPGAIRIRISGAGGEPLLDAAVTPAQIAAARRAFRWRTAALALAPWIAWLLVTAAAWVRLRPSHGSVRPWLAWTAAGCGLTLAARRCSFRWPAPPKCRRRGFMRLKPWRFLRWLPQAPRARGGDECRGCSRPGIVSAGLSKTSRWRDRGRRTAAMARIWGIGSIQRR
jgi:hypothetical protein